MICRKQTIIIFDNIFRYYLTFPSSLLLSDLARLQHIFAWKQLHKTGIKLQEFQRGDDYRVLWKRISNSREKFVLLDCSADIMADVINASIGFNMTGSFNVSLHTYLFGMFTLYILPN